MAATKTIRSIRNEKLLSPAILPPTPADCPNPDLHGNPFRYCPSCNWIEETPTENPDKFLEKAKASVARIAARYGPDELYIVWFCKVLGNWKALVSTDAVAGMYWEVIYNGAKKETYVDTYRKAFNDRIPDDEEVV
jgi:hypothetical protein